VAATTPASTADGTLLVSSPDPGPSRPWHDRLVVPTAGAAVGACLIAVLRLIVVAHGHPGDFVVAGAPLAHRSQLPSNISYHHSGYDGEFFYRLARDPLDLKKTAFGITFDDYYRAARIGYPVLAFLLSLGGRAALVPWSLIAVNVVAITALGLLGGILARQGHKHAAWGLLLAGYFGFVLSLSRDTAEPTEVALMVAGLLAFRAGRPLLAAAALSCAVLTRETGMLMVGSIALVDIFDRYQARRGAGVAPPRRSLAAWAIPSCIFVAWELVAFGICGHIPLLSDTRKNLALPFTGMAHAASIRLAELPARSALIWAMQVGAVAVLWIAALVVVVVPRFRGSSPTLRVETVALVGAIALMCSVPEPIWVSASSDFRSFADSAALAAIVLLGSRLRPKIPAVTATVAYIVVALFRITSL
jgi:hypothetical protein